MTDWIQALSALAMVALTLGLVLLSVTLAAITFWYAWHTKKVAEVMTRDYEAKVSPILDGPKFSWIHGADECKALLNIGNLGHPL